MDLGWLKSNKSNVFYLESYLRPGNTNFDLCLVTMRGEFSVILTSSL